MTAGDDAARAAFSDIAAGMAHACGRDVMMRVGHAIISLRGERDAIKALWDRELARVSQGFERQIEELKLDRDSAVTSNEEGAEIVGELKKQIPPEMGDRRILLKTCSVGHSELVGENWTEHECPWCQLARARGALETAADKVRVHPAWDATIYSAWRILVDALEVKP